MFKLLIPRSTYSSSSSSSIYLLLYFFIFFSGFSLFFLSYCSFFGFLISSDFLISSGFSNFFVCFLVICWSYLHFLGLLQAFLFVKLWGLPIGIRWWTEGFGSSTDEIIAVSLTRSGLHLFQKDICSASLLPPYQLLVEVEYMMRKYWSMKADRS